MLPTLFLMKKTFSFSAAKQPSSPLQSSSPCSTTAFATECVAPTRELLPKHLPLCPLPISARSLSCRRQQNPSALAHREERQFVKRHRQCLTCPIKSCHFPVISSSEDSHSCRVRGLMVIGGILVLQSMSDKRIERSRVTPRTTLQGRDGKGQLSYVLWYEQNLFQVFRLLITGFHFLTYTMILPFPFPPF